MFSNGVRLEIRTRVKDYNLHFIENTKNAGYRSIVDQDSVYKLIF